MRIKPITQSTGKRLRSSTENKTVPPGGSRKLYICARKVIELWIETKAVISWVTPTTAFLMRQLIIASRLGRTEYQFLLMKTSWWDRNIKIRYKCLVAIDEFLTVLIFVCFKFLYISLRAFNALPLNSCAWSRCTIWHHRRRRPVSAMLNNVTPQHRHDWTPETVNFTNFWNVLPHRSASLAITGAQGLS